MKKLFTLIGLIAAVGFASAQNLKLVDLSGNTISNTGISVTGSETITYPMDEPIKSRAFVINTSGNTINVNVKRYIISVPSSVTEQFCFGIQCYAPGTDVGPVPVDVLSADTNKTFYGDLFPNGIQGIYQIRYVFYDFNAPDDSVYLDVTFQTENLSTEKGFVKPAIANPYPNPAKDFTVFEYNLNSVKEANLVIYDMAGNVVKEKSVIEPSGKLKLNLEDLNSGVYFYTFYANGKAISTKRLVISK